jgi:hypothetical protein
MKTTLSLYDKIIQEIEQDRRPLLKFSDEEIETILIEFSNCFQIQNLEKMNLKEIENNLSMFFCLLTNTQTTSKTFQSILIKSQEILKKSYLDKTKKVDLIVMFFSSLMKQFIDHSQKTSDRYPDWLYETLRYYLNHHDPEVLEWTLRTIESMGHESFKFRDDIKKLRPSLLKIFNTHQRYAFEIVELLEKQWSRR